MNNWFLKISALVIVVVSYLDTAIGVFQIQQIGLLLFISSFVFMAGKIICFKKDTELKWNLFDILATVSFFLRMKTKYTFTFNLKPIMMNIGIVDSINTFICNTINHTAYYAVFIYFMFAVLNAVLSSYGWGITRIVKATLYIWEYRFLYGMLRHKWISKLFNKRMVKKGHLSQQEAELLHLAAKNRYESIRTSKNKREASLYFPIVFRKHAKKKSFMPKWLYNISLVQGNNISMKWNNIPKAPRSMEFVVNLTDSHLAIINNSGKAFLKNLYDDPDKKNELVRHNKEINDFLSNKNTSTDKVDFYENCFYRWGSAGTLPMVEWNGSKWVVFVYRDIYPMGWNLPLGASECELEKGRPGITAIREMLEEVVILKDTFHEYRKREMTDIAKRRELYHSLLNSIEGETNYQATKRKFYGKQREIIQSTCSMDFSKDDSGCKALYCSDVRTTMQIRVEEQNRKVILPENVSTNCMITVDNFEQGIECIKPVRFALDPKNELRMGEVDLLDEKWINNPVILIKLEKIQEYFTTSKAFQKLLDSNELYKEDDRKHGEGLNLKELLSDENNYHLFGVQMQDRKNYRNDLTEKMKEYRGSHRISYNNRKKYRQLRAQLAYLDGFVQKSESYFEENDDVTHIADKDNNPAYYLCPAAWKACYYFFSNLYKGEEINSIGE